jgi:hypothetical protein
MISAFLYDYWGACLWMIGLLIVIVLILKMTPEKRGMNEHEWKKAKRKARQAKKSRQAREYHRRQMDKTYNNPTPPREPIEGCIEKYKRLYPDEF